MSYQRAIFGAPQRATPFPVCAHFHVRSSPRVSITDNEWFVQKPAHDVAARLETLDELAPDASAARLAVDVGTIEDIDEFSFPVRSHLGLGYAMTRW